jgi:hypothetical protein
MDNVLTMLKLHVQELGFRRMLLAVGILWWFGQCKFPLISLYIKHH